MYDSILATEPGGKLLVLLIAVFIIWCLYCMFTDKPVISMHCEECGHCDRNWHTEHVGNSQAELWVHNCDTTGRKV